MRMRFCSSQRAGQVLETVMGKKNHRKSEEEADIESEETRGGVTENQKKQTENLLSQSEEQQKTMVDNRVRDLVVDNQIQEIVLKVRI
jgi:hypothetical protein